jgi:hypothetical protein
MVYSWSGLGDQRSRPIAWWDGSGYGLIGRAEDQQITVAWDTIAAEMKLAA